MIGFGVVVLHLQQSFALHPPAGQTLVVRIPPLSQGDTHTNLAQVVGVVVGMGVVVAIKQQSLLSQPPFNVPWFWTVKWRHSFFAWSLSGVHPGAGHGYNAQVRYTTGGGAGVVVPHAQQSFKVQPPAGQTCPTQMALISQGVFFIFAAS